jgi:hypothetical protein
MPICGKEYPASFSGRALKYVANNYGSLNELGNRVDAMGSMSEDVIDSIYHLLWLILDAGRKKAVRIGEPETPEITEDDLLDLVGAEDFEDVWALIGESFGNSAEQDIHIDTEIPNAEATGTPEV